MCQRDRTTADCAASSGLSDELIESYTCAIYRVDSSPGPIFLAVGATSPALDLWLGERAGRRFAFLSAANPGSVQLPADANRLRHQRLLERLQESGLTAISGESYEAASGGWRETSLLICGIERGAAIALARDFGQAALLYGEIGGQVELVFTGAAPERS
ncbi:MAG: DUF3293 domain-containing protein [Thermoanaerobaculia bacterium]